MNNFESLNISELLGNIRINPPFYEACSPLLIYGAGNIGKDVYAALKSRGVKTSGFLDRKAVKGEQWNGIPVYSPDWDGLSHLQKQQAGIIIALHNRDVAVPPIIKALRERGYGRIITLIEFTDHFPEEMGDRLWLIARMSYQAWEADISKGYKVWEDESSRQLYLSLLHFRLTGNYDLLPMPDADRQYFPFTLPQWETPLRFIDGGAYDGDTIRELLNTKYSIEAIAAFEPDADNFKKLRQYISSIEQIPVYSWPCGIYSSTRQLSFAGDGAESSKLSKHGGITIQVVALDDVIPSFKPNLIKFDIEGAEYEGLLGAKRLITENRPGLAICLYHRPRDLWRIPLLIESWDLRYRVFLRLYGQNSCELVMYAMAD